MGLQTLGIFGGYPTVSGKTVRWRQLYRSSKLSGLTDMGLATFESLRIRMVIDLRSASDTKSDPDRLPQGVHWQNIEIVVPPSLTDAFNQALKTGDTSGLEFDKIVQDYTDFYISNVEKYGKLLPLVMSSDNRPHRYTLLRRSRAHRFYSRAHSAHAGCYRGWGDG